MLSGENNNDVESVNNDKFFGCLFNQSEPKKDAAAKRIEGFLLAIPAKKIDDNSSADAALKKLFVQYNTSLPSSAAVESFTAVLSIANLNSITQPQIPQNSNRWSTTANPQVYGTIVVIFLHFRNRK